MPTLTRHPAASHPETVHPRHPTPEQVPPPSGRDLTLVMRELRAIAAPIVKRYETDLNHDEDALENHPHAPAWLWVPYESGTHLAVFTPRGLPWLRAVRDHLRSQGGTPPTPYVITHNGVFRSDWDAVGRRIDDLEEPCYLVSNDAGTVIGRSGTFDDALATLRYGPSPAWAWEMHDPQPLAENDPPAPR